LPREYREGTVFVRYILRFLVAVALSALVSAAGAYAEADPLILDLETLQARSEVGVFQAEPVANARVGEVSAELLVAVVVPDVVEAGEDISVYLCDGVGFAQWISGELDAAGEARLGERIGAQVHVRVEDTGDVFGVAQVPGGGPQPFWATAETGDAGLYRAEEEFGGVTHVGGWIVLPDGRQKGDFCCGCIVICFPHCCIFR